MRLEHALLAPMVSRYKVMANLDITEKRRPQDGRITLKLRQQTRRYKNFNCSAIYGEKIVMRILGQVMARDVPELEN